MSRQLPLRTSYRNLSSANSVERTAPNSHIRAVRLHHIAPPTPAGTRHTVIDKVSPLLTSCEHNFSACYLSTQQTAFDEAMVGYKGRDATKQYIRSKRTRWGYKVWCLACDEYLLSFTVHKGDQRWPSDNVSLHDTMLHLVRPYANRGHILYLNNRFTSPALLTHLHRIRVRACGPLRPNRKGVPADMQ